MKNHLEDLGVLFLALLVVVGGFIAVVVVMAFTIVLCVVLLPALVVFAARGNLSWQAKGE